MKRILFAYAILTIISCGVASAGALDDALETYRAGDFEQAWQALLPLGQEGDAEAQYHLGLMRENGTGVAANDSVALMWYRAAAAGGHAEAQYRLGRFYEFGRGTPLYLVEALKWYQAAADQDLPAAQARLGLMLFEGLGIAPDEMRGLALIEQAAEAGDPDAAKFLAQRFPPPPPVVVIPDAPQPVQPGATANALPPLSAAMPRIGRVVIPPPAPDLTPEARELYDRIVAEMTRMAPYGTEIRMAALTIEQAGSSFHVAMPGLVLVGVEEGVEVRLDTLEFDVTPGESATYLVTLAWPALVTVHGGAGAELAHISFGERSFTGTWAPLLGGYLDQRLGLADVVLSIPDVGIEVRAATIAYEAALVPVGGGRVTGPSAFSFGGLTIDNRQGQRLLAIGSISGTGAVRGLDRGLLNRLNEGAASIAQSGAGGTAPGGTPDLSFLPATPGDIVGDASMDVTMRDVSLADPTGVGSMYLAGLGFAIAVNGLDSPLARLGLSYRHDGLALAGDAASPLAPKAFNLDLAIERLPAARLYVALLGASLAAFVDPNAGPDILLAGLPALFVQAGTELRVAAIDIDVAGAEAHGSGRLVGDPSATGDVVGAFEVTVQRLDRAIAALVAATNDPAAQEAAVFLTVLQGLGAPGTDADGAAVLAYRIEITPTGATLNGQDLETLMPGAMGGAP